MLKEIVERRSIRKYKPDMVCEEDLQKVLEAGRLAPSGSNTQPWRFLIVTENQWKEKIVKVDHNQQWMMTAPVFLVCIADLTARKTNTEIIDCTEDSDDPDLKLIIRDTAIAESYMMLEATHLGLGTCWTGWFEQREMRRVLNLPEHVYISGVITLGYPDETPDKRPRKVMEELMWNQTI